MTIRTSGSRSAPWSVGGNLNVFASNISQEGVLRAPLGSITLGWDGTDADLSTAALDQPLNPIAGDTIGVPVGERVMVKSGSITSVSLMNADGSEMMIPFGLSPDGFSWIDPRGVNITLSGLPEKSVSIRGANVMTQRGSTIDISGGGDLYAFRWVAGTGGSADLLGTASNPWNAGTQYQAGDLVSFGGKTWTARVRHTGETPAANRFWTLVPESYAIVPGYDAQFAPYAPFNTGANATALAGDPGFVSRSLHLGDQIYLDATPGLKAGNYTLLPRRYALLPGAFLVTPTGHDAMGTITLPEGATNVSGYTMNAFIEPRRIATLRSQFEVASSDVIRGRASYDDYGGNRFFTDAAAQFDIAQPQLLPIDAGYAAFHGNMGLRPDGMVMTGRPNGGRGAAVDVSSFADIYVTGGTGSAPAGATAVVKTSVVNAWGAESLFIGGLRQRTPEGTTLEVRAKNLVVNNPGDLLKAPDLTLGSQEKLTVTEGSAIAATGSMSRPADIFEITGDGALVRVSRDLRAGIVRTGITDSTAPLLTIGADARIAGVSVTLDSTYGTLLDPETRLRRRALTLGSGQISILLEEPSAGLVGSVVDPHLVLAGDCWSRCRRSARSPAQLSHHRLLRRRHVWRQHARFAFDAHRGHPRIRSGRRRRHHSSSSVLFSNPSNVAVLADAAGVSGTLNVDARTVRLGENTFAIAGYENVNLNGRGRGDRHRHGELHDARQSHDHTPLITGARGSTQAVTAGGRSCWTRARAESAADAAGSARPRIHGREHRREYRDPAAERTPHAARDHGRRERGRRLDVAGTEQEFYDLIRYTDAGRSSTADHGSVTLTPDARVSVAGATGGGDAGRVTVAAPNGAFLQWRGAHGRRGGRADRGSFILDVGSFPSFATLGGS